jgi:hypothetical protein
MVPRWGVLVEGVVPPGAPGVGVFIWRGAPAPAAADEATAVALFLPEWSAWFERFQDAGFFVWPTDYYMVGRNFHPRFDMRWLREAWWYQLADSDLV